MKYELKQFDTPEGKAIELVVRQDGAMIPIDESNSDYQAYLRWLENPNEVEHLTEIIPADEA